MSSNRRPPGVVTLNNVPVNAQHDRYFHTKPLRLWIESKGEEAEAAI